MKYIINILLLSLIAAQANGQQGERIKYDFVPSSVYFSTDVVHLATTIAGQDTKLAFQSKIDCHYYFLALDYGIHKYSQSNTTYQYENNGSYFRIGPQVNMMPYNPYRASIYFGLSYAAATFSDRIDYSQTSTTWPDAQISLSNNSMKSSWYELNTGLDVPVVGPFSVGYIFRFQFSQSTSAHGDLVPFSIPGFGSLDKKSNFSFNYYITYKLAFRNKPIPIRPTQLSRRAQQRMDQSKSKNQ